MPVIYHCLYCGPVTRLEMAVVGPLYLLLELAEKAMVDHLCLSARNGRNSLGES